jgi:RND family efflux transporter MFP subunit
MNYASHRTTLPIFITVAAALLAGCHGKAEPLPLPGPPSVTVATPLVRAVVEWDTHTGRLAPVESVEVRSRLSGYLQSIHIKEGQDVEKGALLAVIDPRPFEAELARAEAQLKEALAGKQRSEALLAQANAVKVQALSAKKLAERRLDNARLAIESDAIAKEQFDVRENEVAQAAAEAQVAQAAIASAHADIATTTAAIETASAVVQRARLDLRYTRIRAPIGGRIGRRLVTRGNLIEGGSVGATLLTTIVRLDPIHVHFDVDEQSFLKYTQTSSSNGAGTATFDPPVYLALINERGFLHRGRVDFIDNRIDPGTGTMRGRAILSNKDRALTPGLFANLRLPSSPRHDVVLVPDDAIGANQAMRYVLVVDADNVASPRPVTLGPLIHGLRVIRSGLDGTERVIIRGLQRVMPGATVIPVQEELTVVEIDDGLPRDDEPVADEEVIRIEDDPLPRKLAGLEDESK